MVRRFHQERYNRYMGVQTIDIVPDYDRFKLISRHPCNLENNHDTGSTVNLKATFDKLLHRDYFL